MSGRPVSIHVDPPPPSGESASAQQRGHATHAPAAATAATSVADPLRPEELFAQVQQRPTYGRRSRGSRTSTPNPADLDAVAASNPSEPAAARQHRHPPRQISTEFLPVTQDAGGPRYSPYVRGQHHSPASHAADPDPPQRTPEPVRFHTEESEAAVIPPPTDEKLSQQLRIQVAPPPPPSAALHSPSEVEMQQIMVRQANEQQSSALDAALSNARAHSPQPAPQATAAAPAGSPKLTTSSHLLPTDMDRPSAFHTIFHFLLRFFALACLLICALVRVNILGAIYFLLFFLSIGLIAFKRFHKNASGLPQPLLSPLLPFVLPGWILTLFALLAMAVVQLVRRFTTGVLDGYTLTKFGLHYTEPYEADNVALLFVPFLISFLYFTACLVYIRWKDRMHALVHRSTVDRQAAEEAEMRAFQRKNLDEPLRKLDILTKDPRVKAFTAEEKQTHESKVRAKYAVLLALHLKDAKSKRRSEAALHRGSSKWVWWEAKVYHPMIHVILFAVLLVVGILERSVLSYVYFLCWSIVLTKWSLYDRIPPSRALKEEARTRRQIDAAQSELQKRRFVKMKEQQQSSSSDASTTTSSAAGSVAPVRENEVELIQVEAVAAVQQMQQKEERTGVKQDEEAAVAVALKANQDTVGPVVDDATKADKSAHGASSLSLKPAADNAPAQTASSSKPSSPDPSPLPAPVKLEIAVSHTAQVAKVVQVERDALTSSVFSSFPTYASFPLMSYRLPLFRFYQFLWLYSSGHLLLKYVFRGLFLFGGAGVNGTLVEDLTSVETAERSHLLFFFGEYALPEEPNVEHSVYTEEGFHIGLLLFMNLYLGILLHLSRKPYVYLPLGFGTWLFGKAGSVDSVVEAEVQRTQLALAQKTARREELRAQARKAREAKQAIMRAGKGDQKREMGFQEVPRATLYREPTAQHPQRLSTESLLSPNGAVMSASSVSSFGSSSLVSPDALSPSKNSSSASSSPSSLHILSSPVSAPPALMGGDGHHREKARLGRGGLWSTRHTEVRGSQSPKSAGEVEDKRGPRSPSVGSSSSSAAASGSKVSQKLGEDAEKTTTTTKVKPAAPSMTKFQVFVTFLGRTLWFLLPASCFMYAILYASYPGLTYLVMMFLAAYFSLKTSFRILPFVLLYTQGINHTHYIYHLTNPYWNDEEGSDYLTNITIPLFVSFLISSIGVAYYAYCHRYAHRAILFWEVHHGFATTSLIEGDGPGFSPLGLLSPRLGHHDRYMKKQAELVEAKLQQWKLEDAARVQAESESALALEKAQKEFRRRQQERKERLKKEQRSEVQDEEEALHAANEAAAHAKPTQMRPSLSKSPAPAPKAPEPIPSAAPPADEHKEALPAPLPPADVPSAQKAAPAPQADIAGKSAGSRHAFESHDEMMRVILHPVDAEKTEEQSEDEEDAHEKKKSLKEINDEYTAAAHKRAVERLKQHVGFDSEEAYAAAQIQAAYRGRKAREAMEKRGIPTIVPTEVQQTQLTRHHHHHHHRKKKEKQKTPTIDPADEEPPWYKRAFEVVKKSVTNFVLILFSYSNMLIMVLLYIIGILRVDIIHGVYMLLFLAYAISPWMRRHHGIVVIWSSVVIIAEYLWNLTQFSNDDAVNNDWTDRVGLIRMGAYNRDIYPHLAILILSGCFHRFSPEEAATAQLQLNQLDEEARMTGKKMDDGQGGQHAGGTVHAEPSVEDINRSAYASYWYSPYQPFYRTIVTAGLVLCTAITLWAGLVNSLMTDDTVREDSTANSTGAATGDIGVSLIAGVYLIFVFVLLLVHQLRPGLHAYPYDRAILFLLSLYSGGVVVLQYVYQFGVLDSSMRSLSADTNNRFTAAEIGVFRTPGSLYRSLLTHSIVLFVCVAELRILRLDLDPITGKSISIQASKSGSVENTLEHLEEILLASESRLKRAEMKKRLQRQEQEQEKLRLAELQKRKMAAFEANDFEMLHAEFAREHAMEEEKLRQKEEAARRARMKKRQPILFQATDGSDVPNSMSRTVAMMKRRSVPMTLLIHFFARVGYYVILFCDWFILQHTDKMLSLTLFLAAITHVSLMGAWYMILAFLTLLLLGYPRLKALLSMVSAMVFITLCFVWQFPLRAFDVDYNIIYIVGLNKDSTFGKVVTHHIAVLLMGAFYGTTFFWLRIHQRKTMASNELEEFEAYQEKMMRKREELDMHKQQEVVLEEGEEGEEEGGDVVDVEQENAALMQQDQVTEMAAASAVDSLLNAQHAEAGDGNTLAAPIATPNPSTPTRTPHRRTMTTVTPNPATPDPSHHRRNTTLSALQLNTPNMRGPKTIRSASRHLTTPEVHLLHSTSPLRLEPGSAANVMPALLSTLPHSSTDATSAAPLLLTPSQHSSVVRNKTCMH